MKTTLFDRKAYPALWRYVHSGGQLKGKPNPYIDDSGELPEMACLDLVERLSQSAEPDCLHTDGEGTYGEADSLYAGYQRVGRELLTFMKTKGYDTQHLVWGELHL